MSIQCSERRKWEVQRIDPWHRLYMKKYYEVQINSGVYINHFGGSLILAVNLQHQKVHLLAVGRLFPFFMAELGSFSCQR